MVQKIDWNLIPNPKSIQKKALKLAIETAGSAKNLSLLIGCHKSAISKWLKIKINNPKDNVMSTYYARKVEKALKIKDIKYKLCPELKDENI